MSSTASWRLFTVFLSCEAVPEGQVPGALPARSAVCSQLRAAGSTVLGWEEAGGSVVGELPPACQRGPMCCTQPLPRACPRQHSLPLGTKILLPTAPCSSAAINPAFQHTSLSLPSISPRKEAELTLPAAPAAPTRWSSSLIYDAVSQHRGELVCELRVGIKPRQQFCLSLALSVERISPSN